MATAPAHECAELLLDVLVETGGEAVVLHAGEQPYLLDHFQHHQPLATAPLTPAAVQSVCHELLSHAAWQSLGDLGAVEYECAPPAAFPQAHFKVVAEDVNDDLRVEVHRMPTDEGLSLPSADELWTH